ncbi:uncharacterized protein T551_01543 [Pneumocystis jirovecii RU7]|uniref:TLC domain-containing protein n=1 Tax=Pneumocystis jirovecii (strain RU7) TaxID=1408657 RepID=A0A0W4ZRI7_PNEJ7|nr:uncharacterized protein T551_01543 [Pneumocystis jirovecii RU7]KTW30991.1 hypothetical protein T551_01543 [Pneumocystis jirovecii RU7]
MSKRSYKNSHRKIHRKKEFYNQSFQDFIVQNLQYLSAYQQEIALTIILVFLFIHVFIPSQNITQKLFYLSYCNVTHCTKGKDDWYFVAFWIILFSFIRESAIRYIFIPFARNNGVMIKNLNKFSEQAWCFLYYLIFWSFETYIVYNSPYWFNYKQLWIGYPHIELKKYFKWYYLVQFSFWIHQIFVLNIETRRKDYYGMLFHHIITCILIFMSYVYHFTQVGNVVMCIMDMSDIFLSLAKMLKYLKMQKTCNFSFFIFLISWIITRHFFFLFILYSTYKDAGVIISHKWDPINNIFFTKKIHMSFLALLSALQFILCFWLCLIIKVTWKVITGHDAEDNRSESENDSAYDDASVPQTHLNNTELQISKRTMSKINSHKFIKINSC